MWHCIVKLKTEIFQTRITSLDIYRKSFTSIFKNLNAAFFVNRITLRETTYSGSGSTTRKFIEKHFVPRRLRVSKQEFFFSSFFCQPLAKNHGAKLQSFGVTEKQKEEIITEVEETNASKIENCYHW